MDNLEQIDRVVLDGEPKYAGTPANPQVLTTAEDTAEAAMAAADTNDEDSEATAFGAQVEMIVRGMASLVPEGSPDTDFYRRRLGDGDTWFRGNDWDKVQDRVLRTSRPTGWGRNVLGLAVQMDALTHEKVFIDTDSMQILDGGTREPMDPSDMSKQHEAVLDIAQSLLESGDVQ